MSKQLRILIVDDEPAVLSTFNEALSTAFSLEIHEAAHGLEALKKLEALDFHYVITDTNMPAMNGVELLRRCKEIMPPPRVVVLFSGLLGSSLVAENLYDMGADLVVAKPEAFQLICADIRKFWGL